MRNVLKLETSGARSDNSSVHCKQIRILLRVVHTCCGTDFIFFYTLKFSNLEDKLSCMAGDGLKLECEVEMKKNV